jgi:hypothetical protein
MAMFADILETKLITPETTEKAKAWFAKLA